MRFACNLRRFNKGTIYKGLAKLEGNRVRGGPQAGKGKEHQTLPGLKGQVGGEVTGTWEEVSCEEGPLPMGLGL